MKNKRAIIIIGICICVCIGIVVVKIKQNSLLGNLKRNLIHETSSNSEISFNAKKGDIIKLSNKLSINKGSLRTAFKDSDGNVIDSFELKKNSSRKVSINKDGEYILSVTYNNFIGNFAINVTK
ncbi:hypothetical protein [Anaerosacchariphilus polymeriproducens]|uniref:Adhesin-like protein n=1 Tax=Anaerosacchariphilus polymeriproducens TaxID=1812858 RepID=A0A371AVC5_9FIRM|nr:hypothetical protein [Anaerosacchariphilus polymeriproducens]RDU23528.1 hypothetical protein DWV06_09235 [Anaerosacchariphilus polymeriproducens]